MTKVEFTRTPPTKAGHPRMAAGFAFVYAGHHSRQQVSERRPAPTKANPHTTFFRDRILVSNNLNPRPLILRNFIPYPVKKCGFGWPLKQERRGCGVGFAVF